MPDISIGPVEHIFMFFPIPTLVVRDGTFWKSAHTGIIYEIKCINKPTTCKKNGTDDQWNLPPSNPPIITTRNLRGYHYLTGGQHGRAVVKPWDKIHDLH